MTWLQLLVGFGRVGLLGFGGGPSLLPLMQAECLGAGWLTEEQFREGVVAGQALPGPIATKMATYVGWQAGGAIGALAALVGLVAPTAVMMVAATGFVVKHQEHPWVAGALRGARPAVVAMLAYTAWDLAPTGISSGAGAAMAAAAFGALVGGVHPALVMMVAVAVGAVAFRG